MNNNQIFVILHNIRSTHNVGSVFRTSDAGGVGKIFLTGYTPAPIDRFGRKVKDIEKVALGAEDTIPWKKTEDIFQVVNDLKKDGFTIVAIEQAENSVDYKKVEVKEKIVLIMGNEVTGVEKEVLDVCDVVVEIPMKGEKESLNVSVAFGIALFRVLGI